MDSFALTYYKISSRILVNIYGRIDEMNDSV